MRRDSQSYPSERRDDIMPYSDLLSTMHGEPVNPTTGDVTVRTVGFRQRFIGAYLWDALGYLDVMHQQQTELQAQVANQGVEIAALREDLTWIRATLVSMMGLIGAYIPGWVTHSDVTSGVSFLMGQPIPTAESLGLIVEFVDTGEPPGVVPGATRKIEPPVGTLVPRGSKVKVFHTALTE